MRVGLQGDRTKYKRKKLAYADRVKYDEKLNAFHVRALQMLGEYYDETFSETDNNVWEHYVEDEVEQADVKEDYRVDVQLLASIPYFSTIDIGYFQRNANRCPIILLQQRPVPWNDDAHISMSFAIVMRCSTETETDFGFESATHALKYIPVRFARHRDTGEGVVMYPHYLPRFLACLFYLGVLVCALRYSDPTERHFPKLASATTGCWIKDDLDVHLTVPTMCLGAALHSTSLERDPNQALPCHVMHPDNLEPLVSVYLPSLHRQMTKFRLQLHTWALLWCRLSATWGDVAVSFLPLLKMLSTTVTPVRTSNFHKLVKALSFTNGYVEKEYELFRARHVALRPYINLRDFKTICMSVL